MSSLWRLDPLSCCDDVSLSHQVLWYGGIQVINGEMSPGTLTSFLLYTIYIATGLSVISGLVSEVSLEPSYDHSMPRLSMSYL